MSDKNKEEEVPEIPLIRHLKGDDEENVIVVAEPIISVCLELGKQVELAGPLILVGFLQYSIQMISVVFIGHLGALSLSSATMATCFAGVTGYYFMLGMASALETFLGQAYGAKQYHMLGIHLQRAMLVLMLTSIPIAFIWNFTEQIFRLCGQDPEISTQAGIYARWLIPSLLPYALLQCEVRFLQAQNNVKPLIVATVLTTLVHVPIAWILVFGIGFGSRGAALSTTISYWINVVLLGIYIRFAPACRETWTGFSKEGMKDVAGFLSLAVPSAFMICLEYWAYELLVLTSGLLPNPKLQTSMMAISYDTCSLVFRVPYGLSSAISTRVSNELGAGHPQIARLSVQVGLCLAATQGFFVNLVLFLSRNVWGCIYTNDKEVVKFVASVIPVLLISNFMDGMQAVLSGTARGCGWQKMGAYANLVAYYLVGIPLAIVLAFVFHFGGKGLWMGIIGGSGTQTSLLLALTIYTDWEHQARKAREQVQASNLPSEISLAETDFSGEKLFKEGVRAHVQDSNAYVLT